MGVNLCYHHMHCADKPAVAKCTHCGKSLCAECADKFRTDDGQILCVDCFNAELKRLQTVSNSLSKKHRNRKRLLLIPSIILGCMPMAIGLFVLLSGLFTGDMDTASGGIIVMCFGLWVPSIVVSFFNICKFSIKLTVIDIFDFWPIDLVLTIIGFVIGIILAPIFFAVNLVKHIRDEKIFRRMEEFYRYSIEQNNKFLVKARSMSSGVLTTDAQEAAEEIRRLQQELEKAESQNNDATIKMLQEKITRLEDRADSTDASTESFRRTQKEFALMRDFVDRKLNASESKPKKVG